MPARLLTDAERGRFIGFPEEVPEEDLYAFFTLTGADRAARPARSAPANRLGLALCFEARGPVRPNFSERRQREVRRISLLRGWVNKALLVYHQYPLPSVTGTVTREADRYDP